MYFVKKCLILVNSNYFLEGWKTPVVYLKNRLVYDLTTSSASLLKRKRQKTDIEDSNCIDLINDDDGDDNTDDGDDNTDDDDGNNHDLIITNINRKSPCIMFSGYTNVEQEKQVPVIFQLNLFYFM